jgi:hypothetical protein
MPPEGKLWFRRKSFGWGWTPASIEGWLSMGAYILVVVALSPLRPHNPLAFYSGVMIATGVMIALGFLKGEPPRWQWGRRNR